MKRIQMTRACVLCIKPNAACLSSCSGARRGCAAAPGSASWHPGSGRGLETVRGASGRRWRGDGRRRRVLGNRERAPGAGLREGNAAGARHAAVHKRRGRGSAKKAGGRRPPASGRARGAVATTAHRKRWRPGDHEHQLRCAGRLRLPEGESAATPRRPTPSDARTASTLVSLRPLTTLTHC